MSASVAAVAPDRTSAAGAQHVAQQHGASTVYLATNSASDDALLRTLLATALRVLRIGNYGAVCAPPDCSAYDMSAFHLSLLEQQLCAAAPVFLGSQRSSWTSFVAEARAAQQWFPDDATQRSRDASPPVLYTFEQFDHRDGAPLTPVRDAGSRLLQLPAQPRPSRNDSAAG